MGETENYRVYWFDGLNERLGVFVGIDAAIRFFLKAHNHGREAAILFTRRDRNFEKRQCECEHIAHFEKERRTPNGNPGHKYGAEFYQHATCSKKTTYGTMWFCVDCTVDCQNLMRGQL